MHTRADAEALCASQASTDEQFTIAGPRMAMTTTCAPNKAE